MKMFKRILAIVLLVIAFACFACALLSALGAEWGTALTADILATGLGPGILGLAWGWWVLFGVIALIAAYACDPEYVASAFKNLVTGAGKMITTILDAVTGAVTSSNLFWILIAIGGAYLLLNSGDDGESDGTTVVIKQGATDELV